LTVYSNATPFSIRFRVVYDLLAGFTDLSDLLARYTGLITMTYMV